MSNKRVIAVRYLLVSIALLLVAAGLPDIVWATASTHIWSPSTDIQDFKSWHVTCDMYVPDRNDASGMHVPTVTNIGLTTGVLPFKSVNAEIGFDHKSGLGAADDYPLYANVKIGVPEEAIGGFSPALAIGIFDVGSKADVTDYNVAYVKAAKSVSAGEIPLGRLSLGYFTGNDKLLVNEVGRTDNDGLLAAWERTMTEISPNLWLCVEFMGSHSAYGTWNLGGSWKFAPNVALLVGYDLFLNSLLTNTATMQVDIDF